MPNKQVQIRKGTTAENDAFTGALAEMSYDTQEHRMRVHDGATVGGFRLALNPETRDLDIGAGIHLDTDGSASFSSGALTISSAGAITFPDGVRQSFNPNGTTPGLNVGANAGDPSTPINGDLWYNSTTNKFRARENGISINLSPPPPFADGTAAAPGIFFTSDTNSGYYLFGADQLGISANGAPRAVFQTTGLWLGGHDIRWSNGFGSAVDVILFRDGSNLGLRANTALGGIQFHLYNNYTNDLNWERVNFEWNANSAFLSTERQGTGSYRSLALGSEGPVSVFLRTNGINRVEVDSDGAVTVQANDPSHAMLIDQAGAATSRGLWVRHSQDSATTNGFEVGFDGGSLVNFQVLGGSIRAGIHLLFNTDNAHDIGAALANRPRDLHLGRNIIFPDGVRQTFNPDSITPGLNVGSNVDDPSTLTNGDIWYNSSTQKFRARENGVTVDVISATPLGVTKGGTGTATQFTEGSVVFAGASGVYSQDNANFFWDDTNNRLGIGSAVPGGKLHIATGTVTTQANGLIFRQISTWNNAAVTFLGQWVEITNTFSGAASAFVRFDLDGSPRFQVNKLGYLYVSDGTDATFVPTTAIELFGQSNAAQAIRFTDTQGGTDAVKIQRDVTTGYLEFTTTVDFFGAGYTFDNQIKVAGGAFIEKLDQGTYTPTLTNVANLGASTAYQCQWVRVGRMVTVSGKVDVDPTLTATATQLGISLPVASNLGAQEDCAGTAFASGIAGMGAAIRGDAVNNRAEMVWIASDITNQPLYFCFQYEII